MAVATDPQLSSDLYPALFRSSLDRFAARSLTRLRACSCPLPAAELDQALHLADFALGLSDTWPAARDLVLTLAPMMEQQGSREDLSVLLESALAKSQKFGDRAAEAELHWHLGTLRQLQREYPEARSHLETSATQCAQLGLMGQRARALIRLASVARQQGHLEEAERLLGTAFDLLEANAPQRAYALSVQGQVALNRHHWRKAAELFDQALDVARSGQDQRMVAWLWVNRGMAMWRLERYRDSITCYQQAIEVFEDVEDPLHRAVAQMDLGIIYAMQRHPAAALEQYRRAEPVFRMVADAQRLAKLYNNIGYVYHELLEQWPDAEHFYRLSIESGVSIGDVFEQCNALDNLGLAYAAQGRWTEAVAVYESALGELEKIERNARYVSLFDEVWMHLDQAREQLASSRPEQASRQSQSRL